jgi:hypothetical protein
VARLNLNWPGQQITAATADEWFGLNPADPGKGTGPLADFPAAEVWDAIDRCRRDLRPGPDGRPRGAWLPNLADILAAIDANWRERAKARRELEARQAKVAHNSRGGNPPPPETTEVRQLLERSKRLPGTPDYLDRKIARPRIDVLAGQLNERLERERMGRIA